MSEVRVSDFKVLSLTVILSAFLSFIGVIWLSLLTASLIPHYSFGIACSFPLVLLPFILIIFELLFQKIFGKYSVFKSTILVSLYTLAMVSGAYADKDWPSLQPARAFISRYLCPEVSKIVIPWFMAPPRPIAEQIVMGGVPIPWGDWLPSIIFWWVFAMTNGFWFLAINLIFRKHWIDIEKLPFPQTELAYRIVEVGLRPTERRTWLLPLMIGAFLGLLYQFPLFMTMTFPWFPDIYGWRSGTCWFGGKDLSATFPGLTSSIAGLGFINIHPIIAVVLYVAPLTTLFSIWFWYLVYIILMQVAWYMGYYTGIEEANSCCKAYTYIYYPPYKWPTVTMGAALGIFIMYIFASRSYILNTLKAALGKLKEFEKSEPAPYKFYYALLLASFIVAVSLWSLCGVSLPAALLMPIAIGISGIVASRFVGTTGWPEGVSTLLFYRVLFSDIWSPWPTTREFGLPVYYAMHSGHWKGGGMASVLAASSFKMSKNMGGDDRLTLKTYIVSQIVAPLFSILSFLYVLYTFGVSKLGLGPYDMMTEPLIRYLNPNRLAVWPVSGPWVGNLLAGLLAAAVLAFLRSRFIWFPLDPIGFVMGIGLAGWGAIWGMTFAAWVAKSLTLRLGGSKAYEEYGIPFVSGFIIGYTIAVIVGGLVSIVRFFIPF